jgi:hypothetical protein
VLQTCHTMFLHARRHNKERSFWLTYCYRIVTCLCRYYPKGMVYHCVFRPLVYPFIRRQCIYAEVNRMTGELRATRMSHSAVPPKAEGAVRLVCLSDTHSRMQDLCVPMGDVLLYAGVSARPQG